MLRLYPMPVTITEKEGTYEFSYVSVKGIENKIILGEYADRGISISADKPANVRYTQKDGFSEQEYELIVNETGAEVLYSFEQGAFYATQTLCQIIRLGKAPFVEIKDAPLLLNRQFSLDISRGKIPTMQHFKEIIDYLAMARYDVLTLYYDRIVFQFPSLEGLWEDGAITMEELRQIKTWCNEKFIKMYINVEGFGHLENFLKHDRFKHLSNSLDENNPGMDLNPLDPGSLEFVDLLLSEVMPFCDTDFIAVSVDEVGSLETGKSKDEVKRRGKMVVYMEYVNKIYNLVTEKYHKIPRFSGDMYLKRSMTDEEINELLKLFPKGAIAGDWGYESEYEYHKFERNNRLLQAAGIKFENKASTGTYAQYVPRTYNQTLNAEVACRQGHEHGAYSVATSTWGDDGNSQFFVMELGGTFTFGATAWNYKGFQLSHVHEYMDKYVFKTTRGSLARTIAGFGDAAWYTKGKAPSGNMFATVYKSIPYHATLYWKGYHAHTGIDSIHIYDLIDEYGCTKALEHVETSGQKLNDVVFECENASVVKEKIALNLKMFELAIRVSYFKLCVAVTKDYETAKALAPSILSCFDMILENFHGLWVTENRDVLSERFLSGLKKNKVDFCECLQTIS